MTFWSDLGNAIGSYFKAIAFVFKHGLWYYFIFPLALSAVLFLLGYYSLDWLNDLIAYFIKKNIGGNIFTNAIMDFLIKKLLGIVTSYLRPILVIVMGVVIQYLVLIICSPIMGSLSAQTDRIITKKEFKVGFFRYIFNLFRGILLIVRNLTLQFLIAIPLALFFMLPFIGWFALPVFFLFSWYFMGFSIMDYTYERRRIFIIQGARFTRKHKGIAIGIGFVFSLILLIPYAGIAIAVVLAPVASTMSVVARMDSKV